MLEAILLSGVLDAGEEHFFFPQMNLDADRKFQEHLPAWRGCGDRMSASDLRRKVYAITFVDIKDPLADVLAELGITTEQFALLGEGVWCELLDLIQADVQICT